MNTHTHAHIPSRTTLVAALLSAMLVTQAASAMITPDQQENPPLALTQAQTIIDQADDFLGTKEGIWYRINKMLSVTRPDVADVAHRVYCVTGGVAFGSGLLWLAQCTDRIMCSPEFDIMLVTAPLLASGLSYLAISNETTLSCYKRAVKSFSSVVDHVQADDFLRSSITDDELEGYVIARFGIEHGALNAIQHYQDLYNQLNYAHEMIAAANETCDCNLKEKCSVLKLGVCALSKQLIKKLAVIAQDQKVEFKEQLIQMRQADQKEKERIRQEQKEQAQARQLELDRAAALQVGNVSYAVKRTVDGK